MNIPGYRIERELGRGGMSTVYLAEQESLGRQVALKVMAAALAAEAGFTERFIKEAKTVARLTHPHIVGIYDLGVVEHSAYLALEYVSGGDLKGRLAQGALAPGQALAITRQVAEALGYAHATGFVHRDVKPENILFRDDGSAVLTDFGIAKAVGAGTRMTGRGMSIGTPQYMSPEQARGQAVDGRSDLYSLGIVLYEMLSARVPFDAEDTYAVGILHITQPVPELPPSLAACQPLLDRLLAKDPGKRYADATQLIAAIDRLQRGERLLPPIHATLMMDAASARGGSALAWMLVGGLGAALLLGGLWVYQNGLLPLPRITGGGSGAIVDRIASWAQDDAALVWLPFLAFMALVGGAALFARRRGRAGPDERHPSQVPQSEPAGPRQAGGPPSMMWLWWVVLIVLLIWDFSGAIFERTQPVVAKIPYSVFVDQVERGNVRQLSIQGSEITGTFKQARLWNPRTGLLVSHSSKGDGKQAAPAAGSAGKTQHKAGSQTAAPGASHATPAKAPGPGASAGPAEKAAPSQSAHGAPGPAPAAAHPPQPVEVTDFTTVFPSSVGDPDLLPLLEQHGVEMVAKPPSPNWPGDLLGALFPTLLRSDSSGGWEDGR